MIPTPQLSLTPEAAALIAGAQAWPRKLTRNLRDTLDLQNELTVGELVQNRMSARGPETLGVVTSRLRRSVRPSKAVVSGTAIESAIGSNVRYMGAHEYGFVGTVQVPQHTRRNAMLDLLETGEGKRVERWESFGIRGKKTKVAGGVSVVRAHTMRLNIKERAPLRRGINDRLPNYREALSATVVNTFSLS